MRDITFTQDVRTEVHRAAEAKGYAPEIVEGVLAAIARDIGRDFDTLKFRPAGHKNRRIYQKLAEGLGLVEAVCEEQTTDVIVIRLRVEAFD